MNRRDFVRWAAAGLGGLLAAQAGSQVSASTTSSVLTRRPLGRTGHCSSVIALGA